jgi:hypothetical protein
MEYKKIFADAVANVQRCNLETDQSSKLSLFGFLHNYVLAARAKDAANTAALEKLLQFVHRMPAGKRYMGLKTTDIQTIITALLWDEKTGKLHSELAKYKYDDLLQYLEICKRVFQTQYHPPARQEQAPKVKDEDELMRQKLLDGDKEAADYICNNQSRFSLMEIRCAEAVLKR